MDDNGLLQRSSSLVVASHELKSPLALLRQLAFELSDTTLTSQQQQAIIHHMEVVSERAMRLTNNITRSASINQTTFPFEPINPVEICEDVMHELFPLYQAMGRDMQLERRTKAPLVIANRDLLRRILLNFGDNALHYAHNQPVRFLIHQVGDTQAQVGLRDTGPVTQVHQSEQLAGRPESSGLGLEICHAFARVMHGHVSHVRHRDGMTFYVQLNLSTQMSLL